MHATPCDCYMSKLVGFVTWREAYIERDEIREDW